MIFEIFAFTFLKLLSLDANSCVASISSFLTAPYTAWFPVAVLAVLAITGVVAILYVLSPLVGRNDIRAWARVKIYDLFFSIVLILVFAAFSTMLCATPVLDLYKSVGLITTQPTGRVNTLPSGVTDPCYNTQIDPNLYRLAICDMYQFNAYDADFNHYFYFFLLVNALLPSLSINYGAVSGGGRGLPLGIALGTGPIDIFPANTVFKYLGNMLALIYGFVLLNNIQVILLSASALLFAILMAIGLIARAFGITRTFGGAMIALAMGLGFIYPLLISVTYGFLDYGLQQAVSIRGHGLLQYTSVIGVLSPVVTILSFIAGLLSSSKFCTDIVGHGCLLSYGKVLPEWLFLYLGFIMMGLVLMPLINFIVVDTFIIDFSQAVGERMDFLSLLTRIA